MIDFESIKLKFGRRIIVCILIILIILGILYFNSSKNDKNIMVTDELMSENIKIESNIKDTNQEIINDSTIYVHISGEVKNPGIVALDEDCRIIDAIEAAGGVTQNANVECVNLAYVISDGMKIHIPNVKDAEGAKMEYISTNAGKNVVEDIINSNEVKKVNVNTATQNELESINGVGPSTAKKIIEYRKLNGKFTCIEEIKNVSGIGNSKYEMMKNNIAVK